MNTNDDSKKCNTYCHHFSIKKNLYMLEYIGLLLIYLIMLFIFAFTLGYHKGYEHALKHFR